MLLVLSNTTSYGTKAGITTSLGIFMGCLVHIAFTITGVSLIIAKSAILFSIIKIIGAIYLIYLGLNTLFTKKGNNQFLVDNKVAIPSKLLWQGVFTSVLNPKVAIFFISFLPQFLDTTKNVFSQLLLLGMWFNIQGLFVLIFASWLMARMRNGLKSSPHFLLLQKYLTGFLMLGLGIKLLFVRK